MSTTEITTEVENKSSVDFMQTLMAAEPEVIADFLLAYSERRFEFRKWLDEQLKEGVHYGFPPGCRQRNVDEKAWKSKHSLYKAGAEQICSLMNVRCEFKGDNDLWKQLGSKEGTFVVRCSLFNHKDKLIGEGLGVRRTGAKSMDENASLKMAEKSALVDAVLHTWALSDLFAQDLEEMMPDATPPNHNASAPQAASRQDRISGEELKALHQEWCTYNEDTTGAFRLWVKAHTGIAERESGKVTSWTRQQLEYWHEQIGKERDGV